LHVVDALHSGAEGHQLLLGLVPITLLDQLLHLRQLRLRRQHDRVVTSLRRLAEQHRPQPVQRIARGGLIHHGTEATKAQHRGRHRANGGQPNTVAARPFRYNPQGARRLRERHYLSIRPASHVIAPRAQHRRQRIHRRHPGAGGQRIDKAVGAHDRVEAGIVVRHDHVPPR
jgi:hypothetical protein